MKKFLVGLVLAGTMFYAFVGIGDCRKVAKLKTAPSAASTVIEPFALMELFTSEGCSNCPPAYRVVEAIIKKGKQYHQEVLLLDFHVDYFNDPWVDPYSSPQNTARQESYSKVFPGGSYTPQMVVNGSEAVLGSNQKKAELAVGKALKITPSSKIIITSVQDNKNGNVVIHFSTENIPDDSMISIALVQKTIVQKVLSGENAGVTLTHHNVVRSFVLAKAKDGNATVSIPVAADNEGAAYSVIAFRQDLSTMKISAATEKEVAE